MRSSRTLLLVATALLLPLTGISAGASTAAGDAAPATDEVAATGVAAVLAADAARDKLAAEHKAALAPIDAEIQTQTAANKEALDAATAAIASAEGEEAKAAATKARDDLRSKQGRESMVLSNKRRALQAEQSKAMKPLTDAFNAAFRAVPLAAWDGAQHGELAYEGMNGWMTELVRSAGQPDIKKAGEIAAQLLDKFTGNPVAKGMTTNWVLWSALSGSDAAAARARLVKLVEKAEAADKTALQIWLGDVNAVLGDYAAAQKTYADAVAALPAAPTQAEIDAAKAAGQRPPADPAGRSRSDLALRVKFVGKDVPQLAADTWFGAGKDVKSIADYKGKVVLLDYWATW